MKERLRERNFDLDVLDESDSAQQARPTTVTVTAVTLLL
jgi:hypothetical protein